MGSSQSTLRPPAAAASANAGIGGTSYLGELGSDIQYERSMGSSRFLKAIKARYGGRALVVKVFVKDPHMDLRPTSKRIAAERAALLDCPNVLPYSQALATERAGYLIRQWVASSLYDRISTRPFLTGIEKKWIAFQLLTGLRDMHARKIPHGDIKSENIVVTSWNWACLSDLSSTFKPTYLPEDDPSDFSYFFDTSGRRTCYLAPERFYGATSEISRRKSGLEFGKSLGRVTEAMDVFSLGCVIAELFVDGTPPFTLSQLFKYRSGDHNLDPYLSQIPGGGESEGSSSVREMIRSMLSVNPSDRKSCDQYLKDAYGKIFPASFYDYLHDFLAAVHDIGANRSNALATSFTRSSTAGSANGTSTPRGPSTVVPSIVSQQQQSSSAVDPASAEFHRQPPLASNADEIISRIWTDLSNMLKHLNPAGRQRSQHSESALDDGSHDELGYTNTVYPVHLDLAVVDEKLPAGPEEPPMQDGPAILILTLLCSNVRNCQRPSTALRALDLFLALSPYLTDETKLDRVLPYMVGLTSNDSASVRAAALRALTECLSGVKAITPANTTVMPEYVLPNIAMLASDSEESVRCVCAQSLAPLAETGQRFLDQTQVMKADGTFRSPRAHGYDSNPYEASYEASLLDLQTRIQDLINALLTDSSPSVRRALVLNITPLCVFLGRSKTNDVFSLMTTHLNDRDPLIRSAFFESTVGLSTCIGSKSVDEYVLPLVSESLADLEESVVARQLNSLSTLAELGLYQKPKLWRTLSAVVPLLAHPNTWIRTGAAGFIAASVKLLSSTDQWCILYPAVRKLLRAEVADIKEIPLLEALVPPLPRPLYEAAIAWASRPRKGNFWVLHDEDSQQVAQMRLVHTAAHLPDLTDDDRAEMQKLQGLGMTEEDSFKLLGMRSHILRTASNRKNVLPTAQAQQQDESIQLASGEEVALAGYGIIPQNIIFSTNDTLAARLHPSSRSHQTEDWGRRWSQGEASRPGSSLGPARLPASRTASSSSNADALRRRLMQSNHSSTSVNSLSAVPNASPRQAGSSNNNRPSSASRLTSTSSSSGRAPQPDPHANTSSGISDVSSAEDLAASASTIRPVQDAGGNSSSSSHQRSKVNMHGVEISRVSAAIASDTATAAGQMTTEPRLDAETSSAYSTPVRGGSAAIDSLVAKTGGRRFTSTYEGDDPSIRQLLDRVYLDNYREPMPEFGANVPARIPRKRLAARPLAGRDRTHRRPEGTLIAHLVEHSAAVTSLAVSPDHAYFASGSADGTVKIWDTVRLEKNVTSRSRQTISQGGRITSVVTVQNTHCIASASDNGTIWISRVDLQTSPGAVPRYAKQAATIRQHSVDSSSSDFATCMIHFDTDAASKLVYGTSQSKVVIFDIRTLRVLQTFQNPKHLGPISCICIDRKHAWLVVGTLAGYLTLWDLRFGLLLRTWKPSGGAATSAIYSCHVHPTKGKGRWIVVTLDSAQGFEVWDIEHNTRVESFRVTGNKSAVEGKQRSDRRNSNITLHALSIVQPSNKEQSTNAAAAIEAFLQSVEIDAGAATLPEEHEEQRSTSAVSATAGRAVDQQQLVEEDSNDPSSSQAGALHSFSHLSVGPGIQTVLVGNDYASALDNTVLAVGHLSTLVEGESTRPASGPSETGWIITGGEDKKLRFWDLGSVDRSAVICGLDEGEERPTYSASSSPSSDKPNSTDAAGAAGAKSATTLYIESRAQAKQNRSNPNRRSQLIANNQQTLLRAHQDAITALALLESPFRCVVSGDRSGVIKVWE